MTEASTENQAAQIQLRPYQEEAVRRILEYAAEHPTGRLLLVVPPGGGKTAIAAEVLRWMAHEQGMTGIAWAHRREIVQQQRDHLIRCGIPAAEIGVVMALDKRSNPTASIQVASVDTLTRRMKPSADIVVSDEAHRDASNGRRRLRALYPDAFHLGMTGTPTRTDNRVLREDYDDMIVVSSPAELIADGFLAEPRVFTVPPELLPDLRGVRKKGGDYDVTALERATDRRALVGGIVEHWKRLADRKRTVAFAVSIKHARHIAAQFVEAGVPAAHLDENFTPRQRSIVLADLRAGRLQVVTNCDILSQGWDLPECKCVIQARPTLSLALHLQQCGRCMRPWEGVEPIILDHAGNAVRQKHGLPQEDREWSLDHVGRVDKGGMGPVKACEKCGAVVPTGRIVCDCGAAFPVPDPIPTENDGELSELRAQYTDAEKAAEWSRIKSFADGKGFSDGWARKVYAVKMGSVSHP